MKGHFWPFVAGLILGFAAGPALAEDLEAGKTAAAIFAADCSACHHSPRGLAKGMSSSSLASFLREHYTTGSGPANDLANYLVSGGAGGGDDRRPATSGASREEAPQRAGDKPGRRRPQEATAPATPTNPPVPSGRHKPPRTDQPAAIIPDSPGANKPRQPSTAARTTEPEHPGATAQPSAGETKHDNPSEGGPKAEPATSGAPPSAPGAGEPRGGVQAGHATPPSAAANDQPAFSAPSP